VPKNLIIHNLEVRFQVEGDDGALFTRLFASPLPVVVAVTPPVPLPPAPPAPVVVLAAPRWRVIRGRKAIVQISRWKGCTPWVDAFVRPLKIR